jgi:plasmid stabilization system protein ParE
MSGFVFHPDALNDLNEIWNFIALDNPPAADRTLLEINNAIRVLLPFRERAILGRI